MRKFNRADEPQFLAGRWEHWGLQWEKRRNEDSSAQFHWHEIDGEKVNQKLLPHLRDQTQNHCSFCDAFPVDPPSIPTVEHFRPKSLFPKEAYQWKNLYFCCMFCQQKSDEFHDALLRPDSDEYEFDRYFRWDFTTGDIKINDLASQNDQNRADVTIRLYRLNQEHPRFRRLALRNCQAMKEYSIDEMPYRHFIA